MNFNEAFSRVASVLQNIGITLEPGNYDGLIIKQLKASNTLVEGRSTNQTHIAITGEQMEMFPCMLRSTAYFDTDPDKYKDLKKYFLLQYPVTLYKRNIEYLGGNTSVYNTDKLKVYASVLSSKRDKGDDQIQLSIINSDDKSFVEFRKLLQPDDFLIMLKKYQQFEYEAFGISNSSLSENNSLIGINNKFYYSVSTTTRANISTLIRTDVSILDLPNKETEKETTIGRNIIYYGVPGAGKSHTIEKDYNINDGNSIVERVVFHPDYTYSDFVGQLLPTTEQGKVKYSFQPGPFTTILLSAIKNPNVQHILIIEEINRGNAPAIFGDLFQLLDREENGESKYKITNKEIANIAYETITDKNDAKISIPSNLTIVATMNTSDQNVFTLDTAFQRRWEMRLIENKFTEQHEFANKPILDTTVTWKTFCETMNSIIVGNGARTTSTEDKRLGIYFVKAKDIELGDGSKNQLRKFPEKVIKYLWDDAFKFNREDLFNASYNSLEDVIEAFMGNNGPERFNIFKADVINLLKPTVEHKEETTEPDNDVAQQ